MRQLARGMTLIEVVVAIVIIAGVGGTVLALLAGMSRQSAATLLDAQRASIAGAYLEEIVAQPFTCSGPAAGRAGFNCVGNYHGMDEAPTDRFGNVVTALAGYRVQVSAQPSVFGLGSIPAGDVLLVTVTVTDPFGGRSVLSGFRTRHP